MNKFTRYQVYCDTMSAAERLASEIRNGVIVYDTDANDYYKVKNGVWQLDGSNAITFNYTETDGNYTIQNTDGIINVTASATITLPTAVGITGTKFSIKNTSVGNITIDTTSSETIDGGLTAIVGTLDSITVVSTGTNYIII